MLHFGLKFPYSLLFFSFCFNYKDNLSSSKRVISNYPTHRHREMWKRASGILALARLQAITSFKSHKAGEKFWRSLPFWCPLCVQDLQNLFLILSINPKEHLPSSTCLHFSSAKLSVYIFFSCWIGGGGRFGNLSQKSSKLPSERQGHVEHSETRNKRP